MVEQSRQDVADLAARAWSVDQFVKPLLHVNGSDLSKAFRTPFGLNMPVEIDRSLLNGGKRLSIRSQFVIAIVGDEFGDRLRHSELGVDVSPKRRGSVLCVETSGNLSTVPMVTLR